MKYLYLFFVLVLFSCKNDVKESDIKPQKARKQLIAKDEKFISNDVHQKLHKEAQNSVENWQEYQEVSLFMPKFYNTSTKEILLNASEFYELTTHLKDSIRVKNFKQPSVKIRLNVLQNEALRLFDMDSIPSITNKEVVQEVKNIINAFNALNTKINNTVKRDLLDKDLSDFNVLFEHPKDSLMPIALEKTIVKSKIKRKKVKKSILKNKKRIKALPKRFKSNQKLRHQKTKIKQN